MVGSVDTGLNVVHVRDVARGHILAAEKGRVGERYILGHRNLSLLEIFRDALRADRRARAALPRALRGRVDGGRARWKASRRITRRPPAVPLTAVRMARKRMYFSAAKAIQELGLPQTPAETALKDAVDWFVARGYARKRERRVNAHQFVSRLTRKSRSNFFYAFLCLPRAQREAIFACYAFCRIVDDAVDLGADRAQQRAELGALARGDRAGVRGAARAPGRPASAGGGPPLPDPARRARGDHRRRGDGHRPSAPTRPSTRCTPTATGWPRRWALLHRDLRLLGSAGARVRGQPGRRAPAHQYPPRRPGGRAHRAASISRRRTCAGSG